MCHHSECNLEVARSSSDVLFYSATSDKLEAAEILKRFNHIILKPSKHGTLHTHTHTRPAIRIRQAHQAAALTEVVLNRGYGIRFCHHPVQQTKACDYYVCSVLGMLRHQFLIAVISLASQQHTVGTSASPLDPLMVCYSSKPEGTGERLHSYLIVSHSKNGNTAMCRSNI